jgi:hypothetical protein
MSMATSLILALLTCQLESYDGYVTDCSIPCFMIADNLLSPLQKPAIILSYTHAIFLISI